MLVRGRIPRGADSAQQRVLEDGADGGKQKQERVTRHEAETFEINTSGIGSKTLISCLFLQCDEQLLRSLHHCAQVFASDAASLTPRGSIQPYTNPSSQHVTSTLPSTTTGMTQITDYEAKEVPSPLTPDLLSRRLYSSVKRLNSLSVSNDGRIALALSSTVSVLNPVIALNPNNRSWEYEEPESDIRPPLLGHELVYSGSSTKEARKDTTLSRSDIAAVSWGGETLFIVNGGGECMAAMPVYEGEGTWGGILGGWKIKEMWKNGGLLDIGQRLIVKYCTVCSDGVNVLELLVVGTKKGVYLYRYEGWENVDKLKDANAVVHEGWGGIIECLEGYEKSGGRFTLLGVGGSCGEVDVYAMWYDTELKVAKLWDIVAGFGPVSCLSWNIDMQGLLTLLVGVGNGIVIAEWEDSEGWEPVVSRIQDAHGQMVSGIEIGLDGRIVSSSLDGTICRWERKENGMNCARIREGRGECVMGMGKMGGGVGVAALITTRRSCTEVGGGDDAKYAAGARRSMLSLYATEVNVGRVVDMVESGRQKGGWEVFMNGEGWEEIGERLDEMADKWRSGGMREDREQFEEMIVNVLSIARVWGDEQIRQELSGGVCAVYYDRCLERLLEREDLCEMDVEEWRAAESMCEVLSRTPADLLWNAEETVDRVAKVRKLGSQVCNMGSFIPCTICLQEEENLPLTSTLETFSCAQGDTFSRCILTGLPIIHASLECPKCKSNAQTTFNWTWHTTCPLCRLPLLPNAMLP